MHSSGMRTARLLTASQQGTVGMGIPAWGVYLPRGVYLPGGTCPGGVPAKGGPAWGVYPTGGYTCLGGVPAWGDLPRGCSCQGGTCPSTPLVDRQTPVKT